jgi:hypothetical protein
MFSFLFQGSSAALQGYIDRVAFLMRYLEQHGLKEMHEVVASLRKDLLLNIPDDEQRPDERHWVDPSNRDLAISFRVGKDGLVTSFMIAGFGNLSNTLVLGSALRQDNGQPSFTWNTCPESESRPIPRISREFQQAFWGIPGYKLIGLGKHKFLVHD